MYYLIILLDTVSSGIDSAVTAALARPVCDELGIKFRMKLQNYFRIMI